MSARRQPSAVDSPSFSKPMITYNALSCFPKASAIKTANAAWTSAATIMTDESVRTPKHRTPDGLAPSDAPGMLSGLTAIEYADETAEYCGLLLAGLGAEVIKIEPPGGNSSRSIAPFQGDSVDKQKSLYFWAYNRARRSVV